MIVEWTGVMNSSFLCGDVVNLLLLLGSMSTSTKGIFFVDDKFGSTYIYIYIYIYIFYNSDGVKNLQMIQFLTG